MRKTKCTLWRERTWSGDVHGGDSEPRNAGDCARAQQSVNPERGRSEPAVSWLRMTRCIRACDLRKDVPM